MFFFIYFEWRDTENQQSFSTAAVISDGTPFSLLKSYDVTSQMNSIYHGTFTWFFLLRSTLGERNLNSTRENPGYQQLAERLVFGSNTSLTRRRF